MSIPGAPALLRPLLARHEDGQEHVRRNLRAELARDLRLTEEDQTKRLPGANQPIFHTNLNNAAFHLTRAGLLEAPSFGATRISPRGRQVLDEHQTLNLGIVASIASERADEAAQEEAGDAADELSPEEAMKALDEGSELVWPKRSWPGSWRKARPFSSASCSTSSSGWVTGDHGKLRQSTSAGSQTVVSMVSSARTRSARTFSMCRPSVMRVSGQSASIRSTNSSAPFRHTECAEAF